MPEKDGLFFIRANDPKSIANLAIFSAATAALTLIDPSRLNVGGRLAYRSAIGSLTGWATWTAVRTEHDYLMPPVAKIGVTIGGVGAALALSEAGETLDARMHDGLTRMGVRRPRVVLAAAAAALGVGSWLAARRVDEPIYFDDEVTETETETEELSPEVRALVAALIGCTSDYGATELHTQLSDAREIPYMGENEDSFYPGVGFDVPVGLPLAVPGDSTFPIIGRYRPIDGRTFDVRLHVQDGRLGNLDILTGSEWSESENLEWMVTGRSTQEIRNWPSPDELELLIETSTGLRPVAAEFS